MGEYIFLLRARAAAVYPVRRRRIERGISYSGSRWTHTHSAERSETISAEECNILLRVSLSASYTLNMDGMIREYLISLCSRARCGIYTHTCIMACVYACASQLEIGDFRGLCANREGSYCAEGAVRGLISYARVVVEFSLLVRVTVGL